jgi:hypothetical protein
VSVPEYGEPVVAFHEGEEVRPTYLPPKQICTPKELAEELREVATTCDTLSRTNQSEPAMRGYFVGRSTAFNEAAQMVEDRLK